MKVEERRLEIAKRDALGALSSWTGSFIHAHYSATTQATFNALLLQSIICGHKERINRLGEVTRWIADVVRAHYEAKDKLLALTTVDEVRAFYFDLAPFTCDPVKLRDVLDLCE